MSRQCPNGVIEEFCLYCEPTEVPGIYSLWTGIFMAAEMLGRDCFLDQGHFVVWPNLYIVLVAGSAVCRKTTAIVLAEDFIKRVEPSVRILSQRMSAEAMIKALSGIKVKDQTKVINEAVGCFINDELSTLIDKNSFKTPLISTLTKLYDCKDFPYETIARGTETVRNPCLSILGGSTPEWLKGAMPIDSIKGGFTSRFIFVFKASNEKRVAWPRLNQTMVERGERILHDLNEMRKMRGPFGATDGAIALYEQEYSNFLDGPMGRNLYLRGYVGRRHVTLLKLAIAFSASRSDEREITEVDLLKALKSLRSAEGGMDLVMRSLTSEPIGEISEHIMSLIMLNGVMPRALLINETRHRVSVRELDVILEALVGAELVEKVSDRGSVVYRYKKKGA